MNTSMLILLGIIFLITQQITSNSTDLLKSFNQTASIVVQAFETKRNLDSVQLSPAPSSSSTSSSTETKTTIPERENKNGLPNTTRIPMVNSKSNNHGSTETSNDYCPAVKAPSSNVYISYNPSYQAATLDEVVTYFTDPTVDDPAIAKTLSGIHPDLYDPLRRLKSDYICYTKECLGCVQILNERLASTIADSINFNPIYLNITAQNSAAAMAGLLGLSRGKDQLGKFCKKLYQKKPHDSKSRSAKTVNVSGDDLAKIIEIIKPSRGSNRPRRDGYNPKPGVTTKLDCNYRRGDLTNDSSNMVGLCNLCWTLRTLPSKYFPRYVNELSCDSNDTSCLSGYGTCKERYRSIDVLYNYGTEEAPKWSQYSINTPVSCECRVQQGSALQNMISK